MEDKISIRFETCHRGRNVFFSLNEVINMMVAVAESFGR